MAAAAEPGFKAAAGERPPRRGYCPPRGVWSGGGFISFLQLLRLWSFHHSWRWLWLISWVLESCDGGWRTKSRGYSKSGLFTVGCTLVRTTPFPCRLRAAAGSLLPPRHAALLWEQMGEWGKPNTRHLTLTSSGVQITRLCNAAVCLHIVQPSHVNFGHLST